MAETNDPAAHAPQSIDRPATERVGELLRKARESRQISIETVAHKLRLSQRYIEALEANEYDAIPADAYVRVYLQSLCRFLSLNTEDILNRFFQERGVTGVDTLKRDPNTKINLALVESPKKNPAPFFVAAIVLALLIFAGILWLLPKSREAQPAVPAAIKTDSVAAHPPKDTTAIPLPTDLQAPADTSVSPVIDTPPTSKVHKRKKGDRHEKELLKSSGAEEKRSAAAVPKKIDSAPAAKPADNKVVPPKTAAVPVEVAKPATPATPAVQQKAKPKDSVVAAAPVKPVPVKDTVVAKAAVPIAKNIAPTPKDSLKPAVAPNAAAKEPASKPIEVKPAARPARDSVTKTQGAPAPVKDTAKAPAHDSVSKTSTTFPKPAPDQPMRLELSSSDNSSWARVVCDGAPSRNLLPKGASKTFSAKDSFLVRMGNGESITVLLDGKPIALPHAGTVSLKIDRSGIAEISYEKWNATTHDRF
jgi:cytoskeleton protein RodZ